MGGTFLITRTCSNSDCLNNRGRGGCETGPAKFERAPEAGMPPKEIAGASDVEAEVSLAPEILEGAGDNATVTSRSGCSSSRTGWPTSCFAGGAAGEFFAGGCALAESGAGEETGTTTGTGCGAAAGLRIL